MITLRTPNGDKAAAAITLRTPNGDQVVSQMVLRTETGDVPIYTAGGGAGLVVEANPIVVTGAAGSSGTPNVPTNTVTVTVSGGTAPYSYLWTEIPGDFDWSIGSPNAASTRFTALDVAAGDQYFTSFECTVTDARGRTGSVIVEANAFNFGGR